MIAFFVDIAHLIRVGWVFAAHDLLLPDMVKGRQPRSAALFGRFVRLFSSGKTGRVGERFAAALEKLGPTYIKLGQMLSSRPDMFGVEVAGDLARLKDKLPAISKKDAQSLLNTAFGVQAQALFPDLEEAVAAASIAQVHKVQTVDGLRAVKIRRPNVEKTIAHQMRALARAARWAQMIDSEAERLNPVAFVAGLARSMREEMDFRFEAGGCDEVGALLADTGYFYVPKVDWDRTTETVLTMEWIDGTPLTDTGALAASNVDKEALAHKAMRGFLHLALNHGVFHADMHEGNLILRPDGSLALIDFGIIGRVGPKEQRYLAEILHGFIERDYYRVAEVHFRAGYVPAYHSVGAFAQALRSIGEPIQGKLAEDVSMSEIFLRLLDYTALFDMKMRPELVLLQKTMAQVEAVCRSLNPKHDIWESAKPIVQKWVTDAVSPRQILKKANTQIYTVQTLLETFPKLVAQMENYVEDYSRAERASSPRDPQWGKLALVALGGIVFALLLTRAGLL